MGKNVWSTDTEDWELRIGSGGVVSDPQGEWDYSTAEAYVNQQVGIEANIRLQQDLALSQQITDATTGCAYIGDDDGTGVIPSFNPQSDTLWKGAQVLTTAEKDQVATNLVNKSNLDGMGKVVLKSGTSINSQITEPNTIYVIRYDFTLDANLTVPSNCVLEFDGGSISANGNNDTITGQNTGIKAGLVKIFNTDIALAGTWNVVEAYPEWFGAKGDGITDDAIAIQKVLFLPFPIYFSDKIYAVGSQLDVPDSTIIKGCHDESTFTPKGYLNGHLEGYETGYGEIKAISDIDSIFRFRGNFITLDDVALNCNNKAIYGINDDGNYLKSRVYLNRVYVLKTKETTVDSERIDAGIKLTLYLSRLKNVIVDYTGIGIQIGSSTSVVLDECYVKHAITGYSLSTFKYSSIRNCCCDHATVAYRLIDFLGVTFMSNGCEDVTIGIILTGVFANFKIADCFFMCSTFIKAVNGYGTCVVEGCKMDPNISNYFIEQGSSRYIIFYVDNLIPKLGCSDNAVIIEREENLVKDSNLYSTPQQWSGSSGTNGTIERTVNKLYRISTTDGKTVSVRYVVALGEVTLQPGKYLYSMFYSYMEGSNSNIQAVLLTSKFSGFNYPTFENLPAIFELTAQTTLYIAVDIRVGANINTKLLSPVINKIG